MNFVGKILIVTIFVMSCVFMGVAVTVYGTHTNWHDKVVGKPNGLNIQLTKLKSEKNALQQQKEKLENSLTKEKTDRASQVTQLENRVAEMKADRDKRESEIAAIRKQAETAAAGMAATHKTLESFRGEVSGRRDAIHKAELQRDDSFKRSVALADSVHQLETEQQRLEARFADLTVDANRMRDLLRANQMDPTAAPDGVLPTVKGLVMAIPRSGLMEISIGSDDGLQKGHSLEVYRIGEGVSKYLGRVEVVRTSPDKAVCQILPEYRKGLIREGDRVASKLE
jgi:outer membrane murein-binding lipoprotein Lpp